MNNSQLEFVAELSKLRPTSTFLTLKSYRNNHSEVSDYSIVFNISYKSALEKSLLALHSVVPANDIEALAKRELIESYTQSLTNLETVPFEELEDHYQGFKDEQGKYIKGIKLHTETQTLHLYGLVAHKKVLVPGTYPVKNKRELTKAKDKLRKLCPVDKFRQFKINADQLDGISVQNLVLLPPSV